MSILKEKVVVLKVEPEVGIHVFKGELTGLPGSGYWVLDLGTAPGCGFTALQTFLKITGT